MMYYRWTKYELFLTKKWTIKVTITDTNSSRPNLILCCFYCFLIILIINGYTCMYSWVVNKCRSTLTEFLVKKGQESASLILNHEGKISDLSDPVKYDIRFSFCRSTCFYQIFFIFSVEKYI